jgi:hypothetical protein
LVPLLHFQFFNMADPVEERIDRVRRDPRQQWGWGPSDLASNEERDAYRVVAGEKPRDIRNDPEYREWAYNEGGYAKSRRTMRMQDEWEKQQDEEIQRRQTLQSMEIAQKQFESGQRDQQMQEDDFYYNRGLKEAEQKLQAQQRSEATAIIGGLTQLDPRDPEYREKRGKLFSAYPLGVTDQGVQKIAGEYEAVSSVYQDSINKSRERESEWLVGQQQDASALKIDTAPFFKTDPQTGEVTEVDQLGLSKAIGEAKRNDLETKKKEIVQSKLDEDTKDQARSILDEINKTDSEIRKANFNAGREKNPTKRDEFVANSEFYRGERDVLVERFNALMPEKPAEGAGQAQPEIPKFATPEEAEAAGLQAGTIVEIGGRRARID